MTAAFIAIHSIQKNKSNQWFRYSTDRSRQTQAAVTRAIEPEPQGRHGVTASAPCRGMRNDAAKASRGNDEIDTVNLARAMCWFGRYANARVVRGAYRFELLPGPSHI